MWILGLLSYYNSERFMVAGVQKKTYMQACNINFENICFIKTNMLMDVSTFI